MEMTIGIIENKKTLYRPFKRCFKYPTNTVTKWIWKAITSIQFGRTSIETQLPIKKHKSSNSRGGSKRIRYASIKGYCGLQRNGYLA